MFFHSMLWNYVTQPHFSVWLNFNWKTSLTWNKMYRETWLSTDNEILFGVFAVDLTLFVKLCVFSRPSALKSTAVLIFSNSLAGEMANRFRIHKEALSLRKLSSTSMSRVKRGVSRLFGNTQSCTNNFFPLGRSQIFNWLWFFFRLTRHPKMGPKVWECSKSREIFVNQFQHKVFQNKLRVLEM